LELRVQVVVDEIKESFEIGVAGVLGKLLTGIVEAGQKGEYLFRGYGIQLSVRKMIPEFGQEGSVGSDRIFFGSSSCGNPGTG
jgi:hypothetical protein